MTRSSAATPSAPRCGCSARQGAVEVHVRISSPPVAWPCFYGIDFASRAELIASGLGIEEIRQAIGADSLAYVSLDGLVEASNQPADNLCTACFSGSLSHRVARRGALQAPARGWLGSRGRPTP